MANGNLLTNSEQTLNFTLNNEGIKDLGKVLFEATFKYGDLFRTCFPMLGVLNGEKAGYIEKMSDVGWAGAGCSPTYKDPAMPGREKTWELGKYSVPLQFCADDLESTIAKYCLKTGTDRKDLTDTDFWDKIFLPLLKDALDRMIWRFAWFGEKNAAKGSDNGIITEGLDLNLFKVCDGFWKRIETICSTATGQRYDMSQVADITASGAALAVVEGILGGATSLIKDGKLYLTKSLYEALRKDYRREYKSTIPFMQVADGVQLPAYDNVPLVVVPEWDTAIADYNSPTVSSTVTLTRPHRAVFMNRENFLVGTSDTAIMSNFDTFFDKKDRKNYTYMESNIGTMIADDRLFQAAY